MSGNPDNLHRAAAAKRAAAHQRANDGLRLLTKRGQPITFAGVATAAGVSKDFLYRSPELRGRIEQLRDQQDRSAPSPRRQQPAPATSDISSVVRTLTLKLSQERAQHRHEVAELRAALAAAHGELLALKRRQPNAND